MLVQEWNLAFLLVLAAAAAAADGDEADVDDADGGGVQVPPLIVGTEDGGTLEIGFSEKCTSD